MHTKVLNFIVAGVVAVLCAAFIFVAYGTLTDSEQLITQSYGTHNSVDSLEKTTQPHDQQPTTNNEDAIEEIVSEVDLSTEALAEVDTSDWQTYRNEEYGFEFKYPQGWGKISKIEPANNTVKRIYFNNNNIDTARVGINDRQMVDELLFGDTNSLATIFFNNDLCSYILDKVVKLKNGTFISFYFYGAQLTEEECDYYSDILVQREIIPDFAATFSKRVEATELPQDLLDKYIESSLVLDSIKEIELMVDTSDWQTYRNEEYGFEFKYPEGWEVVKDQNTFIPDFPKNRHQVNIGIQFIDGINQAVEDWVNTNDYFELEQYNVPDAYIAHGVSDPEVFLQNDLRMIIYSGGVSGGGKFKNAFIQGRNTQKVIIISISTLNQDILIDKNFLQLLEEVKF